MNNNEMNNTERKSNEHIFFAEKYRHFFVALMCMRPFCVKVVV